MGRGERGEREEVRRQDGRKQVALVSVQEKRKSQSKN